jgi:hypothetical protein
VDIHGQPIPGASNSVSVFYAGTIPSAVGQVVINEIMYNSSGANGQYLELYNNSSTTAFDLSGWRMDTDAGAVVR